MAETNTKVFCISCRFFIDGLAMGSCKRFPETKNKHRNDWCGEYQLTSSPSAVVPDHPVDTNVKIVWRETPSEPIEAPTTVYDINTDAMVNIVETVTAEPEPEAPKKRGRPKK